MGFLSAKLDPISFMEYKYKNIGWNISCGLASFGFSVLFGSMNLHLCYTK